VKSPLKASFILSLYLPWLIAVSIQQAATSSYLVAWLGSFFIFYQTWFSKDKFFLGGQAIAKQIMRPLFLQQLIFAGFMCCTSIFFFLDALGYKYFEKVIKADTASMNELLSLIAECQRFSVLGHAALVTGLLLAQQKRIGKTIEYRLASTLSREDWTIRIGIISLIITLLMQRAQALSQFAIGFYNVTVICGAMTMVHGIRNKNIIFIGCGGAIFVFNLALASLSGYKEPLIVNFVILFCLLYPHYKREVTFTAVPFFILLFYLAPTYSSIVRQKSWTGESTAEEAREDAIELILSDDSSFDESYWDFLTGRLSEIGMFTQFVKSTPEIIPYYSTDIFENALFAIIPRAVWKEKPVTEEIAMQRVYDAGVIDSRSKVSAKARPIVDAYLSGGTVAIIIYMFALGYISQSLCNKAESLFGGYETGCVIFFNGFFLILWRGESTEFMVNSVFWGAVAMILFWLGLRTFNYLEKSIH